MPSVSLDCEPASAPSTKTSPAPQSSKHTPPPLAITTRHAVPVSSAIFPVSSARTHASVYNQAVTVPISGSQQQVAAMSIGFLPTPLEQYRLQLYNYAVHMERLRCPQYSAAAAANGGPTAATAAAAVAAFGYSNVAVAAAAAAAVGSGGSSAHSPYTPSSRLALSMSIFPQRIFQPEEPKPQHSYIGLIAMAILSSVESKLVLSDIYQYILDNYPYFRTRGPGWRNSIRHNLSLNDCFVKSGRSANGKGHYWAIHPANMEDFRKGDFRRRKAQRKVRKHMGLSVDDEGTDSPSPPPLAVTPPTLHLQPIPHHHPHNHHLAANTALHLGYLQQQYQHQSPQQFNPQHYGQSFVAAATVATGVPPTNAHCVSQTDTEQPSPHNTIHNPQHQQPQQLSIIKETTTTTASVIANLYSQTRKRQFDVASLLAPDVVDVDVLNDSETMTTTTKRTLITKLSVQQHHHHHHHHHHATGQQTAAPQAMPTALTYQRQQMTTPTTHQQLLYELEDQEDIDVVASDVDEEVDTVDESIDDVDEHENKENYLLDKDGDPEEEVEEDEEEADEDEENNNKNMPDPPLSISGSRTLRDCRKLQTLPLDSNCGSMEDQIQCQQQHSLTLQQQPQIQQQQHTTTKESVACEIDAEPRGVSPIVSSESDTTYKSNQLHQQQQQNQHYQQENIQRLMHNLPNEFSNVDPRIFGRYYGTYMAAAAAQQVAARRITSSISFPLTAAAPSLTASAMLPVMALQHQQQQQVQLQQHHQQQLPQH